MRATACPRFQGVRGVRWEPAAHGATVPERRGQTPNRRQPSAALAARISTSHSSRNSLAPAPSSSAVETSSAAHRTWRTFRPRSTKEPGQARNVLRCASHLVNAIRQVGCIVGRQHDRIGGQRKRATHLTPANRGPLLVGPLATRLPTVLATTAHPDIRDVSATPAARLGPRATSHACRL